MEGLVEAGFVKTIGVSNFSVLQIVDLMASARIPPAVNQVCSHLFIPNLRTQRE